MLLRNELNWAVQVWTRDKSSRSWWICSATVYGQNLRLSMDKSSILFLDCCGTSPTWSRILYHAPTPATCLWTIAELYLLTQVRNFVYKSVLSLSLMNISKHFWSFYLRLRYSIAITHSPQHRHPPLATPPASGHHLLVNNKRTPFVSLLDTPLL